MGVALDSIVSAGCIISGGRVNLSVLGPGVRVHSYCEIERSILMPNVEVGRHSVIRNAILDTGAILPEHSRVGLDANEDRANGYVVTDGGVTVVPGPSRGMVRAAH